MILACLMSFTFTQATEAGALRARLRVDIGKVKEFLKPTADKWSPLRKGVAGALAGAFIYAGGIASSSAIAHDETHRTTRQEVVAVRNANGELLLPVQLWLGERAVIINPALLHDLAATVADFVDESSFFYPTYDEGKAYDNGKLVGRILRYWEEHLGVLGDSLEDAVIDVYRAKDTDTVAAVKFPLPSREVEILKQRLAFLPLNELTAGLNSALLVKDARYAIGAPPSSHAVLRILNAYGNSGYIDVWVDSNGYVKPSSDAELANFTPTNRLYGHSSMSGFLHTRMGKVKPPRVAVRPRDHYHDEYFYNMIVRRAADNGHLGIVNALLKYNYATDFATPLEIASGRGHTEIVKAILTKAKLTKAKVGLNVALQSAAFGGHIEIATALLAAGADDLNAALAAAAYGVRAEMVKFLVDAGANDFTTALIKAGFWANHKSGYLDVVNILVTMDGVDLNAALQRVLQLDENWEEVKELAHALIRAGADASKMDGL